MFSLASAPALESGFPADSENPLCSQPHSAATCTAPERTLAPRVSPWIWWQRCLMKAESSAATCCTSKHLEMMQKWYLTLEHWNIRLCESSPRSSEKPLAWPVAWPVALPSLCSVAELSGTGLLAMEIVAPVKKDPRDWMTSTEVRIPLQIEESRASQWKCPSLPIAAKLQ